MATLMIIGAGMMQSPVIEKAKELGHFVITIDRDINAIGNKFSDCPLEIDTNDLDRILEVSRVYEIDGILTTSDSPIRVVAAVCDKLFLHGPNNYAAEVCTNKFLMREHLSKNKFNFPKYKIIRGIEDISNIDFFPAVIKPVDSSGSRGVKKINSIKELTSTLPYTQSYSRTGSVIVEEFIDGIEYSVETLSQYGKTHIIAITEKTVKGKDQLFFVEDRHLIPANLDEEEIKLINETVKRLIESLDLGDSATHTELKVNKRGIYVIEVGARLGGDFITSDLVPLATGVDMLENVIRLALGESIKIDPKRFRFAGVQFINSENYESVYNFMQNNSMQYEHFKIEPFVETELESSFDRLGYFIASSDNRRSLINILDLKK